MPPPLKLGCGYALSLATRWGNVYGMQQELQTAALVAVSIIKSKIATIFPASAR
jgi:hypothetical protein